MKTKRMLIAGSPFFVIYRFFNIRRIYRFGLCIAIFHLISGGRLMMEITKNQELKKRNFEIIAGESRFCFFGTFSFLFRLMLGYKKITQGRIFPMRGHGKLNMLSAIIVLIGFLSLLVGCGGGTSNTSAMNSGTMENNGVIGGTAVKGPIDGGSVTAYAVTNGMMGTALASGTTDSQGNYQMSIGNYSGPLMLMMSGGTYTDEATGMTSTMMTGDVMTVVIPAVSSDATMSAIHITPLTSMAQAMASHMAGGMTGTNIAGANSAIGNHFMVSDIVHTPPMNTLVRGSGAGATQDMKNYGMALAAMTQYAKNIGMSSSGMVTAMMNDASDGNLDGMMGGTPITMGGMNSGMAGNGSMMMLSTAGTSSMATAMQQYLGSPMNMSGLGISDMQTMMDHLSASDGQLQGLCGIASGGTGTVWIMSGGTVTTGIMSGGSGTGTMMDGSGTVTGMTGGMGTGSI